MLLFTCQWGACATGTTCCGAPPAAYGVGVAGEVGHEQADVARHAPGLQLRKACNHLRHLPAVAAKGNRQQQQTTRQPNPGQWLRAHTGQIHDC